jgi:hypothetical protein
VDTSSAIAAGSRNGVLTMTHGTRAVHRTRVRPGYPAPGAAVLAEIDEVLVF